MDKLKQRGIVIIDYGSQYTQLIARRIRELGVYSQVLPHDSAPELLEQHHPAGYILSGGPSSAYDVDAPGLPRALLQGGKPILGICYGMQLLTHALGGSVAGASHKEYGPAIITHAAHSPLFDGLPDELQVWMSHGDRIDELPPGFRALASSDNSRFAAIGDLNRQIYGVQFHPEVQHTPQGQRHAVKFPFQDLRLRRPLDTGRVH